jgi:hypothetical protein
MPAGWNWPAYHGGYTRDQLSILDQVFADWARFYELLSTAELDAFWANMQALDLAFVKLEA